MSELENVSVEPVANVYFDGKCVSHSIRLADGSTKSVGVIFPANLRFTTAAPERMELLQGRCRVRLAGEQEWREFAGGESFEVDGDSAFDIEVTEDLHYVCHFG